jgi:RNA polymerase sigma-70 factor (ECF subfamily)
VVAAPRLRQRARPSWRGTRGAARALEDGIRTALTAHQRNVLVALAITGVPIDVLAERLGITRGALYKTLHDARRRLRGHLQNQGLAVLAGAT